MPKRFPDYVLFRDVFTPTNELVASCAAENFNPIFNPDELREQAPVGAYADDIKAEIRKIVQATRMDLLVGSGVVIRSLAGCKQQQLHTDYNPKSRVFKTRDIPLGLIAAIQDGTRLVTREGELSIPVGSVLVFRGDFVHAGASYESEHMRLHWYADAREYPRDTNRTYLVQ